MGNYTIDTFSIQKMIYIIFILSTLITGCDSLDNYIYLNNSSTGFPKPNVVLDVVDDMLRKIPYQHDRSGFVNGNEDCILECRKQSALLFNINNPNRVVFSSGATESLNLVIKGLVKRGQHIVTTVVEHNSVIRPLKTLEKDEGVILSLIKCDENGLVDVNKLEEALTLDTVAVIINHCSNVTGIVNDIKKIGDICKKNNVLFVVDVSQSAGLCEIDVQKMSIDVLIFTGHKFLYGIMGIGGVYIKEGIDLRPLKIGGTGVKSDYLYQPETMPTFYEAGTLNLPGIISLREGVKYIRKNNIKNIRQIIVQSVTKMREFLSQFSEVVLYPNKESGQLTTILSFNIKGIEPEDVGYILEKNYGIIVRTGLHCAPLIHKYIGTSKGGCVRVSPSIFTTDLEIQKFKSAIEQIVFMGDKL